MKRITIVIPCFGRPKRTRRIIECLASQTINNWEAWIIGDACHEFHKMLHEDWLQTFVKDEMNKGNDPILVNLDKHRGGFGYHAINHAIKMATGQYFVFAGNDDIIEPNHFEHYLSGIEWTELDFAYYNTWIDPIKQLRIANLAHGGIGHSELIIRTNFLKKMPPHTEVYGHDWQLIQNMMKGTDLHIKVSDDKPTYKVMSIKNKTYDVID